MRRIALLLCIAATMSGCAVLNPSTEAALTAPKHILTTIERASLVPVLAQSLKDPNAAQFKWLPVVVADREGATDYCGLVNGKNSYGGYTGFVRFYAHLIKDNKGQFTSGLIRAVEEPNRERNPLDTRWLNGVCEKFGYTDFSLAD